MNKNLNILISYIINKEIRIVNVYVNNFFLALNPLIIFNILKKALG